MFKKLKCDGIEINCNIPGIYTLTGNLPFKVQVIVTIEIPNERKSWLRCLTSRGKPTDLASIVSNTQALEEHNKRYADNVMDIFTSANNDLMKEQLDEPTMCKAVNELFADEIKELKNIVADKDSLIATQNTLLADKDAIIAKLQAQLEQYASQKS